jgi:hypothetical protein
MALSRSPKITLPYVYVQWKIERVILFAVYLTGIIAIGLYLTEQQKLYGPRIMSFYHFLGGTLTISSFWMLVKTCDFPK